MTQTDEVAGPPVAKNSARTWGFTGLAAVAPVSWGTTYLVTTEFLPPGIPLLSGVIRALPAGLLLLLIARTLPRGDWWWRSAVLGTLNIGAFNALLFVAAYRLPGGVAATLTAVQPLLVAGTAFLLLGEHPTRWRLGWGVAGVVGVGLIVLRGQISVDLIGILAGLAGAASMAVGIVLTKRWGRPPGTGTLAFTGWQLTAGGLLLAPVALAVEGLPPVPDASALGGYAWLTIIGTARLRPVVPGLGPAPGHGGLVPRAAVTGGGRSARLAGAGPVPYPAPGCGFRARLAVDRGRTTHSRCHPFPDPTMEEKHWTAPY